MKNSKQKISFYSVTYIEEDNVSISISIVTINTIEPLWKLNIAKLLSKLGIH